MCIKYAPISAILLTILFNPAINKEKNFFSIKGDIDNNGFELNLPVEKYNGKNLVIRNRRKGDVFRVDDNTHKLLNRVFSDKKIDAGLRDSIPLVCCGNEVLWAVGYFATRFGKRKGEFYKIVVEN